MLFDLLVGEDGQQFAILRSGPGKSYGEAARITMPRLVIEGTGAVRSDDQGVSWRELYTGLQRTGWVEADRLKINSAAQTSYFDDPCATEGVSEGPVSVSGQSETRGGGEPADHVAQLWHLIGPGCDRAHIALGTAWDYDSGGPLAKAVPDGATVEAFGTWARVTIPGLSAARLDAASEDTWNLISFTTRTTDRTVVIDVYAPQPSLFAARVLSDPARLLVDVIPAADGDTESAPPPVLQLHGGLSTFVVWPGPIDAERPTEVAMPLIVRGYSRWFEASGVVEFQHADGSPATARVTGPQVFNPGPGSGWGMTATDWLEVWGAFEFTIQDVGPGDYRLLVGEYPPIDDSSFMGIAIPIRILPTR